VQELQSIISESQQHTGDCKNPFLTRLKSVLSETKQCGEKRFSGKHQEMHSSIGAEDPELERALNFNTVSVMSRDNHEEEID